MSVPEAPKPSTGDRIALLNSYNELSDDDKQTLLRFAMFLVRKPSRSGAGSTQATVYALPRLKCSRAATGCLI